MIDTFQGFFVLALWMMIAYSTGQRLGEKKKVMGASFQANRGTLHGLDHPVDSHGASTNVRDGGTQVSGASGKEFFTCHHQVNIVGPFSII